MDEKLGISSPVLDFEKIQNAITNAKLCIFCIFVSERK